MGVVPTGCADTSVRDVHVPPVVMLSGPFPYSGSGVCRGTLFPAN